MEPIYIIGIPQTHGCWFSGSHDVFVSEKDAKDELERLRTKNIDYMKIFTVYPQPKKEG
jgi:hypothetical protein